MIKPFRGMGIQGRLFLLILIVLVPILLIEAVIYHERFQTRKGEELQANLELARAVGRTFDSFVADVLHTELAIGLAATASPPPSHDSLRKILQAAEAGNPMLRSFTWISPEGKHLVTTNPKIENRKVRNWEGFSRTASGEDWAVTSIFVSPWTGDRVFTISRGIRDPKGKLLGVVACTAVADKLDPLLAVQRGKGAGISLIDSKGMHVYRYPLTHYTSEQQDWLKKYPMIQDVLKGKETTADVLGSGGEKRLVGFAPILSIGWVAAASRAEDEVLAAFTSTLFSQALLTVLVTLAAFGTALAFSRPISRSIIRLRNQALALGQGEMDEKIAVNCGPGEIKDLSGAFNQMAEEVRLREVALRESEQRWATTLASIGDAVIATDEAGRITFMNPVAEELTGWTLREASMKPVVEVFNIVNEQSRQKVENPVIKVLEKGDIVGLANHTILVRKDGTEIPIDDSGAPIRERDGKVMGVVLVFRDITERKRAEEALRETQALLRAVMENTSDPVYVKDRQSRILMCNPALEKIAGKPAAEIVGKTDSEYYDDPVIGQALRENDLRVMESGRSQTTEEIAKTPDGYRIFLSSKAPYRNESGQVIGIIGISHNITERKQMEEELRRSRDELELKVQERTAELAGANQELQEEMARREKAEQQLLQAQKMESIGTLAGGIAHDFNNILGAIVINSELGLLTLAEKSELRNNLELILNSGLRGKDLVRQLLLFSRKSEKKQALITLTPLAKETFKLLRSSIPTTIEMKLHLETESDSVLGDPSQIQQVVMNLCTNAAYAMRGTPGSIDICLQAIAFTANDLPEADMAPGDYVVLSIKDTGCGMEDEVKKRIFEPFFTTKPVGEGTGLGLSVAYGIVKNHRGNITIYSEPGKGSIFRVYLPKADTGASVEKETLTPIPGGKERILFVDDEEFIVNSARKMLQYLGYKVTALMDSREALKLFSADPSQFDLVMTDQTMPFITGESLGKEMIRMRADIPVILCTGYADFITSERAMEMGFRGFIMKPFTVRECSQLIRRVLDQNRSQ